MPQTDIVAELDAIIATDALCDLDNARRLAAIVERARDEIVALRKALHAEMMGRPDKWHQFLTEARAEQREQDARIAETWSGLGHAPSGPAIATAIRNQGSPDAT